MTLPLGGDCEYVWTPTAGEQVVEALAPNMTCCGEDDEREADRPAIVPSSARATAAST